jgi:hypothetical protein
LDRLPVLAESARILAQYAKEWGREDARVVLFARRMSVKQSWAQGFRRSDVLTPRANRASAGLSSKAFMASASAEAGSAGWANNENESEAEESGA